MPYIMVDVESDGPIPGDYSMVTFGAVVVREGLHLRFELHRALRPISDKWIPEALAISGHTRAQQEAGSDPKEMMQDFDAWLRSLGGGRLFFISDNNGYDWQFINYYFHHFLGDNPFGHSSTNLGSLYKGMERTMFVNFKHLRKTKHTHNPVDDAMGNAEALLFMKEQLGLKINLD